MSYIRSVVHGKKMGDQKVIKSSNKIRIELRDTMRWKNYVFYLRT